ncbi:MAG: hypothetical protein AABW89_01845 [Nanoarchaeota archaeon]
MIENSNIEQVKRLLKNEETPKIIVAQDDSFNRKILENGGFDVLLSIEKGNRKNKVRQTDSGLNHVLAKIASKKNIAIGINLEELKVLDLKEKAERLAKIMENVKICRKTKTKIAIKSKSIKKGKDFIEGIGASTLQVKEVIII